MKNEDLTPSFSSFSMERDYENQTTNLKMSLRLFHKGNIEKLTYFVIEKLDELVKSPIFDNLLKFIDFNAFFA